jgi:hypothetical protein
MLEYIFFHTTPLEMFLDYLEQKDVRHEVDISGDTMKVFVPDDLEDELSDAVDTEYDRLFDLNQELMDHADEDAGEFSKVSVDVKLKDGTRSKAFLEPDIMKRLMSVLSHDELSGLIQAITHAVENPDDRPYCQRVGKDT